MGSTRLRTVADRGHEQENFKENLPVGKIMCNGQYTAHESNGYLQNEKPQRKNDDCNKVHSSKESFEKESLFTAALTHLGFYILMFLGFISQLLFAPKVAREQNRKGYAPLYDHFETFYLQYVYRRVRDCWNRPICSVPGAMLKLKDRITRDHGWTFEFTGTETDCINLGSYNYLGFAECSGPCAEQSIEALRKFGCSSCSTRVELGNMPIHEELEQLTAKFLGVEDAIVFGMGFATNVLNIPSLITKGCLVLSDEKNHASLILGLRLSGAVTRVFHHNSIEHLEKLLREAVVAGQPQTGEPWRKIFICVEGIYSMEGSMVNLPRIMELKKKYKAYVYLDEAHSIGATGKSGRGICDYYGIDPTQVDILMGTFTKSFGSAGGYIAGSKMLINHLRIHSHGHTYATVMSPPVAQQIITSMKIIMGEDGTCVGQTRIKQLARNTRYVRRRLHQMGLIVHGHEDSPVIPFLVYLYSKIGVVVRDLTKRNIATVGVGFPATPLMAGRIRICLSAAHTREQLDYVLKNLEELANLTGLKYSRKPRDPNPVIYGDSDSE